MSQTASIKTRLKTAAEVKVTASQAETVGLIGQWSAIASSPEATLELRAAATLLVRDLELHAGENRDREAAVRALNALALANE